jgi:hypothetical protein
MMMMLNKYRTSALALVAAASLGLTGCMSQTTYRPATGMGFAREGYSERQIEPNRFEVMFAGNSMTDRDTVERYLLFRSAELTMQQGYDYFVMADRDVDKRSRTTVSRPFNAGAYGYWGPNWRYRGRGFGWRSWNPVFSDPFFGDRLDINTVDKYEASAEVVMGKGMKTAGDIRALNARDVMARIGPSVVLPR